MISYGPNPVFDQLTLSLTYPGRHEVLASVRSLNGEELVSQKFERTFSGVHTLDLSELPSSKYGQFFLLMKQSPPEIQLYGVSNYLFQVGRFENYGEHV